jgi:ElaB/YqjD/DUF883 family membrane-anchored ribosome-binding protein
MQETKDVGKGVTAVAAETIEKAKDIGSEAIDKGYDRAQEYASKGMDHAGEISEELAEFARRQPWTALAVAFAIGYVAGQALRKLS